MTADMDERCKCAHAKLIVGTCPWCGRPILNGHAEGEIEPWQISPSHAVDFARLGFSSLERMVRDVGPLGFGIAARYIAEVARELAGFHKVKPFHGAISPAVIFINETRSAELGGAELGQSNIARTDRAIDVPVDPSGIADHLAPEQALGGVDFRADIYSLGCTLYFLLAGQAPFPEGTISERLLKHQLNTPESIRQLRPEVPVELAQVCEKMMAKKPAERYQTALEVAEALARWNTPRDS